MNTNSYKYLSDKFIIMFQNDPEFLKRVNDHNERVINGMSKEESEKILYNQKSIEEIN